MILTVISSLDKIEAGIKLASILVTFLSLAATTLMFYAKAKKNKKLQKIAANLNLVSNEIGRLVPKAEMFINFEGKDKKRWVLTEIKDYALSLGIPFDVQLADDLIEKVVKLSKQVNAREEKKESPSDDLQ